MNVQEKTDTPNLKDSYIRTPKNRQNNLPRPYGIQIIKVTLPVWLPCYENMKAFQRMLPHPYGFLLQKIQNRSENDTAPLWTPISELSESFKKVLPHPSGFPNAEIGAFKKRKPSHAKGLLL